MSKDMKFIDNIVSESKGIPRDEVPEKKKFKFNFKIKNLFNRPKKWNPKKYPSKGLFKDL